MKILLFTHWIDIDGMGSAVLCKLISNDVEICFCETENIDNLFRKMVLEIPKIKYDYIFVTDTCLSSKILEEINNSDLKRIVRVFDHHINQVKQEKDKYNFVYLSVENENGLCSGTSLFYDFLIKNKMIKLTPIIDEFVEYTRQYDTWEWDNIYHNEIPHDMTILYDCIGNEAYIKAMLDIINNNNGFILSESQLKIISNEKKKVQDIVKRKLDNMFKCEINGIKGGVVFSSKYVNDFRPFYEKNYNHDVKFIMIVDIDNNRIFYRAVGDFETTDLVLSQGGSGNKKTGSRNITEEEMKKIIEQLIKSSSNN
jgi:oligoribonuclease NrnB/cAMP/cGMP phosphodiesterase (DHH superfamily)